MKCNFCNKQVEEVKNPYYITDSETLRDIEICYECYLSVYGEDNKNQFEDFDFEYEINTHEIIGGFVKNG